MKAYGRGGPECFASDCFEILAEVSSDPIRDELALGGHIDAIARDLDLGGVVEPHSESVLADSVDQAIRECGARILRTVE